MSTHIQGKRALKNLDPAYFALTIVHMVQSHRLVYFAEKEAKMKRAILSFTCYLVCTYFSSALAEPISLGAAPKGDTKKIAERIIKLNFPKKCKAVTAAKRLPDGTIQAVCRGVDYRVFTMYNPDEGRMLELALNCKEAKKLGVSCY